MHRHAKEELWGWTRGELIDAVQTLETEVERLAGFEPVELGYDTEEYPFELETVSGDEEYKD